MKKEFVPYEQALALKELGFNEPCFGHYLMKKFYPKEYHRQGEEITLRPTFSQSFRWFREEYQMVFCYEPCLKKDLTYIFFIYMETTGEKVFVVESKYNKEAELACLLKLIEITKNK